MIHLDVPEKNVRFLSHAPTIEQEEMIGRLVSFAGSGNWEDLGLDTIEPDNLDKAKMLIATNVARKMALDMRLLGEKFSDDAGNKASICARTMYARRPIRVRSLSSVTFPLTSRTSGTSIPTSRRSWYASASRLMKSSLSSALPRRGQGNASLKT